MNKTSISDKEILEMLNQGMTAKEISNKTGKRYGTVWQRIKTLKEKYPEVKVPEPEHKIKHDANYGKNRAAELAAQAKVDVEGIMASLKAKEEPEFDEIGLPVEPAEEEKRKPAIINQDFEDATQDMIASAKDIPAPDPTEDEIDPAYGFDVLPKEITPKPAEEMELYTTKREYLGRIDKLLDLVDGSIDDLVLQLAIRMLSQGICREGCA